MVVGGGDAVMDTLARIDVPDAVWNKWAIHGSLFKAVRGSGQVPGQILVESLRLP